MSRFSASASSRLASCASYNDANVSCRCRKFRIELTLGLPWYDLERAGLRRRLLRRGRSGPGHSQRHRWTGVPDSGHRLERFTGGIRVSFEITGHEPYVLSDRHPDLGGTKNMACRMKRNRGGPQPALLSPGEAFDADVVSQPPPEQWHAALRSQVATATRARMICMSVGHDSGVRRAPGIDMEIARFAEKARAGGIDKRFVGNSHGADPGGLRPCQIPRPAMLRTRSGPGGKPPADIFDSPCVFARHGRRGFKIHPRPKRLSWAVLASCRTAASALPSTAATTFSVMLLRPFHLTE